MKPVGSADVTNLAANTSERDDIEERSARTAWGIVAALFAAALVLNSTDYYVAVLVVLTLAAAVVAATSMLAGAILVAAAPALDAYAILWTEPQTFTVFQAVLIASLVGVAWRVVRNRKRMELQLTMWDVGILVFLLAAIVSVPLSHDLTRSALGAIQIGALVGMYALLSRAGSSTASRERILTTVVAVGTFSALVAHGQAFIPGFPVALLEHHHTGSSVVLLRVSGFFLNPNSLAVLLVLTAILALDRLLRSSTVVSRCAWAAVCLVCASGVALTFSRQGFIGLLVGAITIALISSRTRRSAIVAIAVASAVLASSLAVPALGDRVRSIGDFRGDASAMDRVYLSAVSTEMFAEHPLTGIGMSAFMTTYPEYADPRVSISPVTDGHQMPLGIPAQTGLLGLIAEVVMLVCLLSLLAQGRGLSLSWAGASGIAACCAFFCMCCFNVFYYTEYFWVALAAVAMATEVAPFGTVISARMDRVCVRRGLDGESG